MELDYTVDHKISASDDNVHGEWNNQLEPVTTVSAGDVVQLECRDSWDGHVDETTTVSDLPVVASARTGGIPLTGPIAVEGALPGSVLEIEILDVTHDDWGWTVFRPGADEFGLLYDEFEEWGFHYWSLDDGVGHFVDGIEIPLDPFPGTIGVAPAQSGSHSTTPPRDVGGNLDTKHLVAGTTLYLPIEVEGGLLSIGDGHAAQGDGEVCGGAIETPISIDARLNVRSDIVLSQPQYRMPRGTASRENAPTFATMGICNDLMEASRKAISYMITHLHEQRGLSRDKAYILASVIVDLKINEIVDKPNWAVSAHLPEDVFPD